MGGEFTSTPAFGGDGTVHDIIAMNDTGSDYLTLFNTDLALLRNIHGYLGCVLPTAIIDASGTITLFPTISVQVRPVEG